MSTNQQQQENMDDNSKQQAPQPYAADNQQQQNDGQQDRGAGLNPNETGNQTLEQQPHQTLEPDDTGNAEQGRNQVYDDNSQYVNNVGYLIQQMNQNRLANAQQENYPAAEQQLQNIQIVRERAQESIKHSLVEKHILEAEQVEEFNRDEFQEFTIKWDERLEQVKNYIANQINLLAKSHKLQMEELQNYLENSLSLRYKPSGELLNMRKIQQVLSKQKNYTEAERIQKTVIQLEKKEEKKFLKERQEKIATQLTHMLSKQKQEMRALEIKLDRIYKENDNQRKVVQAEMLQKFINLKAELQQRQRVEQSKLEKSLQIKSFASNIVGKLDGSMKCNQYTL